MTSLMSTTIGCRHPNSRIDAESVSTARAETMRAFFGYGIGRATGHSSISSGSAAAGVLVGITVFFFV
jgi:hypothetical protein